MAMLTLISASDLKASERLVVEVDGNGKAALITAASVGNNVIGLLVDGGAASGDPVSVASHGEVAWGIANAAITAGAWVTAGANSKLVTTTTDVNEVLGKALTTAGAQNDLIMVMVNLDTLSAT